LETQQAGINASDNWTIAKRIDVIDTTACPIDFRQAYAAYAAAWQQRASVEQEEVQWVAIALLRAAARDQTVMYDNLIQTSLLTNKADSIKAEILSTFLAVKQLAIGYGANVSQ